jgi:hypothetical protein
MATFDEFAEVAVATQRSQKKRNPTSSIKEINALLNILDSKKNIKDDEKGGTIIEESVTLGENETVQNYYGAQLLNPGYSPSMTKAKMGWSQKAMFVVVTGREIKINMGDKAFFSFVNEKLDTARDTAANRMAVEIYGDGSIYESVSGLGAAIQLAPGTTTYAGIDAGIYPRWRNQVKSISATPTGTELEDAFDDAFRRCTDGADMADLGVLSVAHYALLEKQIRDRTRYNLGPSNGYMNKTKAALGFVHLEYKNGMPMIWDANSLFQDTANRSYLLCTKHMRLFEHPEAKWTFDDGERPINQDTLVMFAPWMGNMIFKKRRNCCIISN